MNVISGIHSTICLPGDFFTDDLPPADLYILSHVLHSWEQCKIGTLLDKIFNSLPSGKTAMIFYTCGIWEMW